MPKPRSLPDQLVLERALAVFWRQGYAATSLRDLTRATGLGSAALYHRYVDKDGLFVASLRRYADTGLDERLHRFQTAADPLAAIRGFLDELVQASLADPEHRGCLLVNTALDGASIGVAARELVRQRLGEVEAFFASRLTCAVAAGALPASTDIAAQASALLGTVFAIRVMARLAPEPQRLHAQVEFAMRALGGESTSQPVVPRKRASHASFPSS